MIFMKQPSISLNSHEVPGPHYKMWKTVSLDEGASPNDIVAKIVNASMVSLASGGGRLRNIVINCHGSPGSLATGGSGKAGFSKDNLSIFAPLKPLDVGPIWLVACRAALAAEGIAFCQGLAKAAGTLVVASDDYQEVGIWGSYQLYRGPSFGQIDNYEGMVHLFRADGSIKKDIDPGNALHSVLPKIDFVF